MNAVNQKRIVILEALFMVAAATLVGRAVLIQLSAPPKLARLADRQFKSRIVALPSRGMLYDREGHGLAVSLKVRSLYLRPSALKAAVPRKSSLKRIARALAHAIGMPAAKVEAKVFSRKTFLWLKRPLTEAQEKTVRELGLDRYGDGIGLAEESRRVYPNRELGVHALGTVNIDGKGIEGLEMHYDAILAGEQTRIASLKDARGRAIFVDDHGILAFRHGQSLELTIDKTIQYEAEKTLRNYAEDFGARAATAIVAEVESGEILAMANYPAYDPNRARGSGMEARRNRAVTDIYEPGSVMKPLVTVLALEKGMAPGAQIYCEKGRFKVGDRVITEAETHEKHEWLTLGEILQHSSNIGAAKLALGLGPEVVGKFLERIGIGERTGIDLPGEVSGLSMPLPETLASLKSAVRLANVGFGQGVTATPLQVLNWYMALANGGVAQQPRLVRRVLADDGTVAHEFRPKPGKRLFSAEAAAKVSAMLEKVTQEGGTGAKAGIEEWSVAGKTGTAQKIDPATRRYSKSKYISTFVGFAPANRPKLVTLVIFDEPNTTKRYYAGDTAAPAFHDIMRAALIRRNVPSNLNYPAKVENSNRLALQAIRNEVESEPQATDGAPMAVELNEQDQVRLPDLKGMTVREVMRTVSQYPIELEILGSGILKEQHPSAQQWLEPRAKVRLTFEP